MNQLKHLVLSFRENFKNAAYSIFWQTSLIYLANAMVSEARSGDHEWRFYLELCFAGMEDLYGSFRMSKAVVQSRSLIDGTARGCFSYDEARRVAAELELLGRPFAAILLKLMKIWRRGETFTCSNASNSIFASRKENAEDAWLLRRKVDKQKLCSFSSAVRNPINYLLGLDG
ncbi:hypothetical protein HDV64DRAFT_255461 [Trichoderma sp. TUCIM 5745]